MDAQRQFLNFVNGMNQNLVSNGDCACAVVVAILKRPLMLDCLLLLKQYRPRLANFTLEFPIALVEANETAQEAVVREIEQLTGYKATVTSIGDLSAFDAGISNFTTRLVIVQINGGDVKNKDIRLHPQPHNNNEEGVDVVALPVSDLTHRLSGFVKAGVVVDSRVEMYAMGLKTHHSQSTPPMVY